MKYYFTFAREGQIYEGGWVIVEAENLNWATKKFIDRYGLESQNRFGELRCAMKYTEEEFLRTGMDITGNLGKFCHEIIK
jgi:hypothetical protein